MSDLAPPARVDESSLPHPPRSSYPPFPPPVPNLPPGGPYGYGYGQPAQVDAFDRPLAGWWQRVGALLLDGLIFWGIWVILIVILTAVSSSLTPAKNFGWEVPVLFFIPQIIYFAILDGQSQTLGKKVLRIAVRDQSSDQPIGFGRALGRWIIYLILWNVLFVPGLLNSLSPLWDSRRQAWHDHAVGSVVIKTR